MEIVAYIVLILVLLAAVVLSLVGGIMIIVEAFREDVAWGIVCLIVPLGIYIFAFTHWSKSERGVIFSLTGQVIGFLAYIFAASGTFSG